VDGHKNDVKFKPVYVFTRFLVYFSSLDNEKKNKILCSKCPSLKKIKEMLELLPPCVRFVIRK
jgi:hypothetical protein